MSVQLQQIDPSAAAYFGGPANNTSFTFDSDSGGGVVAAGDVWTLEGVNLVVRTPTQFYLTLPFMNTENLTKPSWVVKLDGKLKAMGIADKEGSVNGMLLARNVGQLTGTQSTAYKTEIPILPPRPLSGEDNYANLEVRSWVTQVPVLGDDWRNICMNSKEIPKFKCQTPKGEQEFTCPWTLALPQKATGQLVELLSSDPLVPATAFLDVPADDQRFPHNPSITEYPEVWWVSKAINGTPMKALAADLAGVSGLDFATVKAAILACFVPA
jgi:hypothetical protein